MQAREPSSRDRETDGSVRQARATKPTIRDVAEAAGVAIGTVSRYLNGFEIRRGNREQIETAIQRLDYRRNAAAASMMTDRTHVIGFLVPAFDEFHGPLLEHLARSVRNTGRALLTYCHSGDTEMKSKALDFFEEQRVDAIIMDGSKPLFGRIDRVIKGGIPVLFYNNDVPGLAADRVFVDNARASFRAVSHLLDLGHERIAIVTGYLDDTSGQQRYEGYAQALQARGLELRPDYVVPGGWMFDDGFNAAKRLLSLPEPPTAVFASNYGMATGILTWMKQQGKRVPQDLSLVSFDDVPMFKLYDDGITAIAQPIAKVADSIINILASRLGDPEASSLSFMMLDCDIILRGSTHRLQSAQAKHETVRS